jgi:hypothetical protein
MKKFAFILLLAAVFHINTFAQVQIELGIANQTVVSGNNLQFDIYLRTCAGSPGDLFLGTADFVIKFHAGSFSSPVLSKVGSSPGSCTFVPTDPSGFNTLFTQVGYFDRTSPAPIGMDSLIINLADPAPGDQATFDSRIAKIDGTSLTHRLGRFQISGLTGTIASANLVWKTGGGGLTTKVFSLGNTAPFFSSITTICTALTLPLELTQFAVQPAEKSLDLTWETRFERGFSGFEIERAVEEATDFEKIATMPGRGGDAAQRYEYQDTDVKPGITYYYRLKMRDLDGQFEYSGIRSGRLASSTGQVRIFPNPATDVLYLEWNDFDPAQLEVVDAAGRVMLSRSLEAPLYQLDVSMLPAGVYFLRLLSHKNVQQELRFVK